MRKVYLKSKSQQSNTTKMASKYEEGHDACRRRVCVCCYRKGDRSISLSEVKCIDEHLIEGYSVDDPEFPCALCVGCHLELSKIRK